MLSNVPACSLLVSILVGHLLLPSSSVRHPQYYANRVSRQASCRRDQYTCTSRQCIPAYNVCDGPKDCYDGSDETTSACKDIKCPSLAFRCSYGACIDQEQRCNGQPDCADGSDEVGCSTSGVTHGNPCGELKYMCSNGQCINGYDTCDGIKNCDDGSDETRQLCSDFVCPSGTFQCDYGACMEPSVKCDGKTDCPDGSDERNCPNSPIDTNTTRPGTDIVGACILPKHPKNGAYTAYTSFQCGPNDARPACRNIPGTPVGQTWVIKYTCNGDYSLNKDSEFSVCENGVWKNEADCIKLCPPLKSSSLDIRCSYQGKEVPCDRPMKPETTAEPRCKQYYQPARNPDYSTLLCLNNGAWTYPLFQCTPDCGVSTATASKPLIINGNATKQGQFPWLAALYHLTNSQQWENTCGGTLITPHIVLTAAHCVVNKNVPQQPSEIRVGLGKYYRDFYKQEESSQIAEVREVIVQKKYSGVASFYALDIALLDLVESVLITAIVMPACVDWSNTFRPAPNAVGVVAGWGKTESGAASDVILSSNLNYIGYEKCLNDIRAGLKQLLTHDKFCAGSPNGSRVDNGDSGGAYTIVKNGLHFVVGVVSTKIPEVETFTLFTDITNQVHNNWLEAERNRLLQVHREAK
ncbi:modular serine protease-like [Macrosteles quadrilineatus]|uniref:modular serine protease-like n=1 Tax=Macrosteles quadrilineatus TaxID=74068 RepID=UPI0023E0E8BB|nr:modular serine protease-like [Macrosteles quadrilineatus]